MKISAFCFLVALAVGIVGCTTKEGGIVEPPPSAPEGARVTRIVVLEQESACECALARQEATWANLQEALVGLEEKPAIDVIHFDVEPDAAQPFRDMKAVMVSPALYFLDEDGALVAAAQGELTSDAIAVHLESGGETDEG